MSIAVVEANAVNPEADDDMAAMYAQGFAWSMQGIAPEVLDRVREMLPDILVAKLPAALADHLRAAIRWKVLDAILVLRGVDLGFAGVAGEGWRGHSAASSPRANAVSVFKRRFRRDGSALYVAAIWSQLGALNIDFFAGSFGVNPQFGPYFSFH